jgi:hypothetical protein
MASSASTAGEYLPVVDPATGKVPTSTDFE